MTILDKATFLAAVAPKITQVEIEGVGSVSIRQLALKEVEEVQKGISEVGENKALGLRLVAASVVNEMGERMFSDDDIETLRASASGPMNDLAEAVMKLNGFASAADQSPN